MMMYDCIIIGGGPSGVAAAARIAQLGGKVCVIEREFLGGVCSNWGCIPTKAMIASAKAVYDIRNSGHLGIFAAPRVDFRKVIRHRDEEIAKSREMLRQVLLSNNVELIIGEGKITDKNTVSAAGREYRTKNIILCTGSRTTFPSFVTLGPKVITSKALTTIKKRPKKLIIMGGGVIGVEFASLFHYLGSDVTIIEMDHHLIAHEDAEISETLASEFTKEGIKLHLGSAVKSIDDKYVLTEKKKIPYDLIMVATGRAPLLDEINLSENKIIFEKQGIMTNNRMQTSIPNIYSIGDNTGKSILAHVGIRQGVVAANNIMGRWDEIDYIVPRCVYSIPEVACVGKTTIEGKNPLTATVMLAENARASVENREQGFVKVIIENNKLVGVQMIGHNVTEIINEATLIIQKKIDIKGAVKIIHPHPTISETLKFAMQKAIGELVELPKGG